MIPWWAIVIGIFIIVMVVSAVRGWVIARRCRRMIKKENVETPINNDEDSESGDAGS